jgi:hypothetical protein
MVEWPRLPARSSRVQYLCGHGRMFPRRRYEDKNNYPYKHQAADQKQRPTRQPHALSHPNAPF